MAGIVLLVGCSAHQQPTDDSSGAWGPDSYDAYTAALADWGPKYVACAREYGAAAVLHPDGTITDAVAEGRPIKDLLDADCVDEVGAPPEPPGLTPEFLEGMYELFLEQAECLRTNGYVVSQPPSRDNWVENYSLESWNPLTDVQHAGLDVATADAMCPQPNQQEAWRIGYSQP